MLPGITVCIPSIPPRKTPLTRAITSVANQTLAARGIAIALDTEHAGAGPTRQRALDTVQTEWTAFLDDDDEFLPQHLEVLLQAAESEDADYVFSWYKVIGGGDPLPHFGKVWDPENPTQTTITVLVRTELAQQCGFLGSPSPTPDHPVAGEDWLFTLRCRDAGGKILHVPQKTWLWHHDSGNTSGRPDRW